MPPRILVVDDDPMTVDLIKAYLEKEHWQVITGSRQLRPWNRRLTVSVRNELAQSQKTPYG